MCRERNFFTEAVLLALLISSPLTAQNGDRPGETQRELPEEWRVEAPGPLSPEEALESFVLAPGYRIELVAAEPLIHDPVQIAFGADGSLWVLEMRGYMPNADGEGEHEAVGRVVRLRDTDGDGQMDTSVVFLENLILPRAIAPARDGLLVVEPPNLVFCRDTNDDGRADDLRVLVSGFAGLKNPEHAGNGLRYGIDNWYETSQHNKAFRLVGEDLHTRKVGAHGQWGVARDDFGRLYYSPNSDPLIGDSFPKHYVSRNSEMGGITGVPRRLAHNRKTYPIRKNPGVNRGYQNRTLRADGTLASFTAACGPEIYRGELLGEDAYGDAFVCETAGNLVKRFTLEENNGSPTAKQAYKDSEFLASTDERFRPVNLLTGPDGALYIVDFYRGIIQHRIYMTTWLRKQVDARGLATPLGMGRIWRVVRDDAEVAPPPDLTLLGADGLVELIASSPNGTVRDTAQRILVERGSEDAVEELREIVRNTQREPFRRIQALWVLEGIHALDIETVRSAASDGEPSVREASARLAESLPPEDAALLLSGLLQDENERVRMQAMLSIGELPDRQAFPLFDLALSEHTNQEKEALRPAVYSGLGGREVAFIDAMGEDGNEAWLSRNGAAQRKAIQDLAAGVFKRRNTRECTELLALASSRTSDSPWQSMIVLDTAAARTKAGSKRPKSLMLLGSPAGWSGVTAHGDPRIQQRGTLLHTSLRWPGRPGGASEAISFSPAAVLARGKRLYGHCMSCHQPNGRGLPPIYPPLDESEFVTGSPERLARILLHGLQGRIEVHGRSYNQSMPAAPFKSDADYAAIMTYIRQAWDNAADPVDAGFVKKVREETSGRSQPWSPEELEPFASQ